LVCLFVLGRAEDLFSLKLALHSYEVTGASTDDITIEVNSVLERIHAVMLNVHVAPAKQHIRVQFEVEGTRKQHRQVLEGLKSSPVLSTAIPLGVVLPE